MYMERTDRVNREVFALFVLFKLVLFNFLYYILYKYDKIVVENKRREQIKMCFDAYYSVH